MSKTHGAEAPFGWWWGPLLSYMALIFWTSSRPRLDGVFSMAPDYVLHAGGYFLLALLAIRAFAEGLREEASRAKLMGGIALAILYGMTDEWHQSFVPGRDPSVADVVADGIGALGAGLGLLLFWRLRGR